MDVTWDTLPKAKWDRMAHAACAPLAQDWAYGEAMAAHGAGLARAVVRRGGEPVALAQFTRRNLLGMARLALCTHGPVWLTDLGPDEQAAAYRALRASGPWPRPRLVVFTPDEADSAGVRAAKLSPVWTGAAAARLDLSPALEGLRAAFHGKWRNRLVAAERADLTVRETGRKQAHYDWLLQTEAKQRRARGYHALPPSFTPAYQAGRGRREALRVWTAEDEGGVCAAMMFLINGPRATYHLGWTNADGRNAGAHNLLLWTAMGALKAAGARVLDLGAVDTDRNPGLARFKLGAGATVTARCGTYL